MLLPRYKGMYMYTRLPFNYINRPEEDSNTKNWLQSMAIDAYIYGYPLVLSDITKRNGLSSVAQINRFYNERAFTTPSFNQVVRPNVDTLYSAAWLDLSQGPMILHVPNTNNRYYVLAMLDPWTNVFASVGARTTGTNEGFFVIVGPSYRGVLPSYVTKIYSPNNTIWIIGRTQTNGSKDYPAVHYIQDNYKLIPLLKPNILSATSLSEQQIIISQSSPKDQVANMSADAFFNTMMTAMYMNPPYTSIQSPEMSEKLRVLDLIPSKDFDFEKLNPLIQHALEYAAKNGPKVIEAAGIKIFKDTEVTDWSILLDNIGSYGTDYTQRAVVAMSLLGANIPQDSVYGYNFVDRTGKSLNGSNNYIIHFNSGQLPPVNAFWSITLYNTEGFLVENLLNRYAISPHLGKLNYNPDGSLDIFVQNASPGEKMESNWLPSPKSLFNLMLRMYWPKSPVLSRHWQPPVIVQM